MLAAHVLCALLAGDFQWPGSLEVDAQAIAKLPTTQRLRALEAMTARAGPAALPLLPPLLADSNPLVRQFAARLLARAGHPAAVDAATRWIMTPAVPLADRGLGLDVLREAPALTPAARQAVERALRDSDGAIRVAAGVSAGASRSTSRPSPRSASGTAGVMIQRVAASSAAG